MAEEKYVSGEEFEAIKAKKPSLNKAQYNKQIILVIVAIIWSIGIFYVGVAYQKHHTKTTTAAATTSTPGGAFGARGGFGGGNFANRTFGTVTAISSTSITINDTRTQGTTTLTINSSTTASDNGQTISISGITVGETVSITLNSTNKTVASSIMVLNFQNNGSSTSSTGSSTQSD